MEQEINTQVQNELLVFAELAYMLEIARKKHPVFARTAFDAADVINAEIDELYNAIDHESEERQREEALDVAVTALRFVLEEHKKKSVDKV